MEGRNYYDKQLLKYQSQQFQLMALIQCVVILKLGLDSNEYDSETKDGNETNNANEINTRDVLVPLLQS